MINKSIRVVDPKMIEDMGITILRFKLEFNFCIIILCMIRSGSKN